MTLQDWVDFWFQDDLRYKVPFSVGKYNESNKTTYPSGSIDKSCVRSSKFIHPFKELNFPSHIQDEVYLVAFLSCWLCKCVFPSKDVGFIRLSTFKVASMMAVGRQFSLAIPVLTSIFKGLKEVQFALSVTARDIHFPIHFLSSWLAEKFGTHQIAISPAKLVGMTKYAGVGSIKHFNESQANALFRDPKRVIFPALLPLAKVVILCDDGNLSVLKSDYFMCDDGKDYFSISDALEYTPKYWEWTEDILKHYELILKRAHIRDTIFASLFTYDWQMNFILSFYNH